MGGWVTMGRLITTSGVMPEGIWDFMAGSWNDWDSDGGFEDGSDKSIDADTLAFFFGRRLPDFLAWEELAPGVVGGLLVS